MSTRKSVVDQAIRFLTPKRVPIVFWNRDQSLGDVSLFVALRCFASAGWATPRAAPGDPRHRFYAERALRAAAGLTGA